MMPSQAVVTISDLQPELLGDGRNEFDIEASRLVVAVHELERSVRCVVADGQDAVLLDAFEVG